MRSRSPSRRSTPPPPRISRRSPGAFRQRGKSPERRRRMVPPAGVPKRSRSPVQREPKGRSFSPSKRKLSPKRDRERIRQRDPERERMRTRDPDRERGRSRERPPMREREPSHMDLVPPVKRTRSKSPDGPMGSRLSNYAGSVCGPSDLSPARSYQGPPGMYPQGPRSDREETNRNVVSLSERFHSSGPGSYKKESEHPVFRGPEGSGFDLTDLKKITMVIRRNPPVEMVPIERNILNPEDVVLKRRPGM
ncbi:hypothetical protein C0J52_07558 [Blattella germanica]|nr:hypothetical protein C0J52_07558 [Blattella germanica]